LVVLQAREEKERRRRAAAADVSRRADAAAAAERARVEALKASNRAWLTRLFPRGTSVRAGLRCLNMAVAPGAAGERAALKRARAYYHPDSARRRKVSLEDQVKCEEIFKALGALQ
jgi:hypothetical protein